MLAVAPADATPAVSGLTTASVPIIVKSANVIAAMLRRRGLPTLPANSFTVFSFFAIVA